MKEKNPQVDDYELVCSMHGELGIVAYEIIEELANQHREEYGCFYPIKVYEGNPPESGVRD
jgi:hypothetical protein